ncbi:MAG: hypothetical protein JO149_05265 [Gammaproteobacteria bacterium]|nr:hypothetical protein [Gammaproteobacteria bacterium]
MNFFQRCVKTGIQNLNIIAFCAALSDLCTNQDNSAFINTMAHGSALLSSLANDTALLSELSVLTNSLRLGDIFYQRMQLDYFAFAINSLDAFIHLLNIAVELTETNRESENNGWYRAFR